MISRFNLELIKREILEACTFFVFRNVTKREVLDGNQRLDPLICENKRQEINCPHAYCLF